MRLAALLLGLPHDLQHAEPAARGPDGPVDHRRRARRGEPPPLIDDVDTQFLFFAGRRSFLGERLATELDVVQSVSRGHTVGVARATYGVTDHLRVRAGYLLLAGSRNTLYGQFHSNDEAYLRIRYSF